VSATCARCGANWGVDTDDCEPVEGQDAIAQLACRDRELANLHSLLRSVTGKLEAAAELLALDTKITIDEMRAAAREIDTVLEALS
jgi:hypothetical protein